MAELIRSRQISPQELMTAHIQQIQQINPSLNAAIEVLEPRKAGDGPLCGVPFSVKDSMDVAGVKTTAGTWGRRNAPPAEKNAALVDLLCQAGAVPVAKTNLPDLLFSFETDNLIFGRTNNPYDLSRTPGGSSGGEAALIAACGSPLGLGSDCLGSVRVPAAFCGIASIKPTRGRLPREGHVPPPGGWIEALWEIGPMARYVEDLMLVMQFFAGEGKPEAPLDPKKMRLAFFTDNGFVRCNPEINAAVAQCAKFFADSGFVVEEVRPPGVEDAYDLELALLGADGAEGIEEYLKLIGSDKTHPLLNNFLDHMRPYRADIGQFSKRWAQWDEYRFNLRAFFENYDAILCPVYTQPALPHGGSLEDENFRGFSYTMAWSVAGTPAATVRCAEHEGLPINVQVVTKPAHDMLALQLCHMIEDQFGGWKQP